MCGRYTHLYKWKQLRWLMGLTTPEVQLPMRFNVAPSQKAPIVRAEGGGGGRGLEMYRWGLVPFWAKDVSIGNRTVNARSETAASTPAFRAAFRKRRCLVPASGFYEWEKLADGKRKQPWYFTPADDDPFVFAGLWETWSGGGEGEGVEPLHTFTILTTAANAALRAVHHRMPVILDPAQFDLWLDPSVEDAARLAPLLVPSPPERIRARKVSTRVNSPANDDPECLELPKGEPGGLWGPE